MVWMNDVNAPLEPEPLASARHGDPAAFQRLVASYQGELYAHCYRMLGSGQDAEDALQESLLGAWRGWFRLGAINLVSLRAGRIVEIAGFLDPEVHRRFGLPGEPAEAVDRRSAWHATSS
jgi:hypothetical protein